ncbi:transcription termination factor MTEF18, mitochondrial [Phoenix dactylifera]|uniref:Transcription termination factor MTEF18, mitochondrial n=1 Tax=Phoenix dactylifera TaxID=42345 RepID=A0A8B7BI12_PHODC|nr:transcription termination factor MTEF18, mitochondrial [Phoenix dactylifera]
MISLRFLQCIGASKMVTQASSAMIFPAVSGEVFGFQNCPPPLLQKNRNFHSISGTPAASLYIQKHPLFHSQKSPFLLDSRAEFQSIGLFDFGRRWNSCSILPAHTPNVSNVSRFLNQQWNRSFSTTQAACADVHVTVMDGKPLPDGHAASRISRMDRIDAQNALFEYLHGTRSLHFTDAEHMSKNSPVFLQNLIAKVENEPDVGRSLTRFLRYHPINEFEPFFESLGLKPSELYPLLPRNLMFLSDDDVLLNNYHGLCNYGVPRSKIGKMYKEGTEMFRYGYGILLSKLQAYEKLGLTKPTIIKLVTCCPELLIGDVNVEFLRVLEKLKSLGVELDWIRGCLSDKSMYNWSRILEMLNFLDRMGCNKKILARLIKEHPRFIFDDSGKKIYILVAMLLKLGLKMNDILTLFVQYPRILIGNFTKNLWKSVQFLADIGMETEDIARIVASHAQVLGSCSCKRPKVVLGSLKISPEKLCEIIKEDPSQFSNLASRKKVGIVNLPRVDGTFLQEKTNFLLKLGFVENSDEMAKALCKFRGRGDQLQERFDCLVNAGFDYHTVSDMIKLVPSILNQSTDIIEKKIDYLLNHLDYSLESLAAFPTFLCYNTDKIKLRFSMYNWLKEQGVVIPTKNRKIIRSTVALSTILACSDARFVKYFVDLHSEGPKVWERLKSSVSSS